MRVNLLKETLECLKENGKTADDVRWVQTYGGYFEWKSFEVLADRVYDAGYGLAEVNQTLMVVGDDWWLERAEYDGSEWWVFKTKPKKPDNLYIPDRLVSQ